MYRVFSAKGKAHGASQLVGFGFHR